MKKKAGEKLVTENVFNESVKHLDSKIDKLDSKINGVALSLIKTQ